ncbi:MAG: dihydrolipoyl dehydrogenase family protein [Actinomycetota bacterium]
MRHDLVIIGMGSAGMIAAEFAGTLQLKVAAVERHRVGGDCLWTGCVPSKALLAAAKVAHHVRHADEFGILASGRVDRAAVWKRVRAIQHEIATTDDNPQKYEQLGVELMFGEARIAGPRRVEVRDADGTTKVLTTKYILLCTGSRPATPNVSGLAETGHLTSESFWDLDDPPASIVVLGGGPIGTEMAQACARLDIATTLLQKGPRLLPRDDAELVARLSSVLRNDGVDVRTNADVTHIATGDGKKVVHATVDGGAHTFAADEILVAAGRAPNVEGLGLIEVGLVVGGRGVAIDDTLRTSIPTIYAAGDVAGRYLFTHSAGYEAVRAVRNMFFPGRGKAAAGVPWATFTDPELAHTGLDAADARARYGEERVRELRWDLIHNDRARADGSADGQIVIITGPKRRIVGAQILAPGAGDLIHELALAIEQKCTISDIASLVHVYPTFATAVGQLAAEAAFERAVAFQRLARHLRIWRA